MISSVPLNPNDAFDIEVTPKMFGAYGDGIHDDTVAIQNSINAIYQDGLPWVTDGLVTSARWFLPKGIYLTTAPIIFSGFEYVTFEFEGIIINYTTSAVVFSNCVRCDFTNVSIRREPYSWAPAQTGLEITGRFWNCNVSIRHIEGFEKGVYSNSNDANGIAWLKLSYQNIYNCKYSIYYENSDAVNGWQNKIDIFCGAIALSPACKAAEVGDFGIYYGAYGAHEFNAHNYHNLALETMHNGINLAYCKQLHFSGLRFEGVDNWIIARSTYSVVILLSIPFQAALLDLDESCRGFMINGNNITEGGDYGVSILEAKYGGLSFYDPPDIVNSKWRIYSDIFNFSSLKLSSPINGLEQILNKQAEGAAAPITGTWSQGAIVWNTNTAAGQPIYWICTVLGTMGVLNGGATTANGAVGNNHFTANSVVGLYRGARIDVLKDGGGFAWNAGVIDHIVGNEVYMIGVAGGDMTGTAVSYFNGTWRAGPTYP